MTPDLKPIYLRYPALGPPRPPPAQHPPKPHKARPSQTEAHDNPPPHTRLTTAYEQELDNDMDTYIRLPYT